MTSVFFVMFEILEQKKLFHHVWYSNMPGLSSFFTKKKVIGTCTVLVVFVMIIWLVMLLQVLCFVLFPNVNRQF